MYQCTMYLAIRHRVLRSLLLTRSQCHVIRCGARTFSELRCDDYDFRSSSRTRCITLPLGPTQRETSEIRGSSFWWEHDGWLLYFITEITKWLTAFSIFVRIKCDRMTFTFSAYLLAPLLTPYISRAEITSLHKRNKCETMRMTETEKSNEKSTKTTHEISKIIAFEVVGENFW